MGSTLGSNFLSSECHKCFNRLDNFFYQSLWQCFSGEFQNNVFSKNCITSLRILVSFIAYSLYLHNWHNTLWKFFIFLFLSLMGMDKEHKQSERPPNRSNSCNYLVYYGPFTKFFIFMKSSCFPNNCMKYIALLSPF